MGNSGDTMPMSLFPAHPAVPRIKSPALRTSASLRETLWHCARRVSGAGPGWDGGLSYCALLG